MGSFRSGCFGSETFPSPTSGASGKVACGQSMGGGDLPGVGEGPSHPTRWERGCSPEEPWAGQPWSCDITHQGHQISPRPGLLPGEALGGRLACLEEFRLTFPVVPLQGLPGEIGFPGKPGHPGPAVSDRSPALPPRLCVGPAGWTPGPLPCNQAFHVGLFFSLLAQGPPGKDGLNGPPGLPGPKVGVSLGMKIQMPKRCLIVGE